jgi:hypothetical protein
MVISQHDSDAELRLSCPSLRHGGHHGWQWPLGEAAPPPRFADTRRVWAGAGLVVELRDQGSSPCSRSARTGAAPRAVGVLMDLDEGPSEVRELQATRLHHRRPRAFRAAATPDGAAEDWR